MQGSLFDQYQPLTADLPPAGRMPLNAPGRKVQATLLGDLTQPGEALVVTGYSGLDQLLMLISQRDDKQAVCACCWALSLAPAGAKIFV